MQRRLRLRDWLVVQIESGNFLGLEWLDKERRIFRVPWKHGSRQSWKEEVDAAVFREWAIYTGRYDARKMAPNPRRWKTNFRCALNALPDIEEVTEKSCTRGNNAFKVYRMKPMPRSMGFRGPDEMLLKRINKMKMNENVVYDGEYWLNTRECKPGAYSPCDERGFYYPNQVSHYSNPSYCSIPVEQAVPNDHEIVEMVDQLLFPTHFQIVDQLAQDFDSDLASNSTGSCVTTPDSACVTSPGFCHAEQGSYPMYTSLRIANM
ncbi:interferon regulatory factor 3 isoform X2 [Exaiptasia diaphana]|uniref:IRF tryptophan pentad repeat domain-containing protein n=1 Tax=Exaiptasia diaphana TaxID=2652724 RepID=A0A913WX72_EXADI|nr:interferon regulatory factor 3 isoform X2 [Exaiptasia diaphana]